jgi:hypothetical protein
VTVGVPETSTIAAIPTEALNIVKTNISVPKSINLKELFFIPFSFLINNYK